MAPPIIQPKSSSKYNFRLSLRDSIILFGVIILALVFRLLGIETQGLWHDEIYTISNLVGFDLYLFPGSDLSNYEPLRPASYYTNRLGEDLFWPNLWRNLVHEGHPPLYLLLTKAWTTLTGISPNMLRLFSAITSTLTIPLIYLIGNRIGGKSVAILAAIIFATSPFQVFFSIEARNYSLLILLATTATASAIALNDNYLSKSSWTVWIASATAACLTHYFAVFYCFLLIILFVLPQIVKERPENKFRLLSLALSPLIIFSTWLPIWHLQVAAHASGHWTDGWVGFYTSLKNAAFGFLELLAGSSTGSLYPEHLFLTTLLITSIIVILWRSKYSTSYIPLLLFLILPAHILINLIVDKALDHHTTSVARYSSCLTIPLTLILAYGLSQLRRIGLILALIYSISMSHATILTSRGDRTPKQMLAEVAHYINLNSSEGDIVVVTPSGPSLVGIALYLKPDTLVTAMPADALNDWLQSNNTLPNQTIWSVQQRLGLTYESWKEPSTPDSKFLVRFVGTDLAKY